MALDLPQHQRLKKISHQVNIRLISDGISSVLQKLLRCFNGTVISTSFVPLFPVSPVISSLNLNEILLLLSLGKSVILLFLHIAASSL